MKIKQEAIDSLNSIVADLEHWQQEYKEVASDNTVSSINNIKHKLFILISRIRLINQ